MRKAREHARVQTCKGKQQQTGRLKCITTTPHSTTHESTTTPHSTTQGLEGKGHTNAVVDLAVSGEARTGITVGCVCTLHTQLWKL